MNFAINIFDLITGRRCKDKKDFCVIKNRSFFSYCCGIVGYLGEEDTNEILLYGINVMKSRGYDSCGVCTLDNGKLKVTKCCSVGTPADSFNILKDKVLATHSPSTVGIGHTRWATVGKLSNKNSHPHVDLSRNLALVHNGTISNIEELYHNYYKDLINRKFRDSALKDLKNGSKSFLTNPLKQIRTSLKPNFKLPDSDSESVAIFVGLEYEKTGDLFLAFKNTIKKLKGTWALCMMSNHYPNSLFVAAHEAPLLVARSNKGIYVGSEPTVFTKFVKECIVLNDGDVFELSLEKVGDFYRNSKLIRLESEIIEESHDPYPNWYMKEVSEQVYLGRVIISLLNSVQCDYNLNNYWDEQSRSDLCKILALRNKYSGNDSLPLIPGDYSYENELLSKVDLFSLGFEFPNLSQDVFTRLKETRKLLFVACGTSLHAASYVAKILQKLHHFDLVEVDDASDLTLYRYYEKDITVIHISNSGETLDCILALNFIKRVNPDALSLSVINTLQTSLERASDATIYLRIGREKSVPSTKAFTAQVVVLLILSLYMISESEINIDVMKDDSTEYCSSVDKDDSIECFYNGDKDISEELTADGDEKYNEHYGSSQNYTISSLYKSLSLFPRAVEEIIKENSIYDKIAKRLLHEKVVYILGRGCGHMAAREASLKMKEVAYVQAEGVLSGAMKHGIYAMIIEKEQTPTISIITSEDKEMTINSTMQLKARGSFIIAITDLKEDLEFADIMIHLPSVGALTPALAVIPLQIISAKIALMSNRNPDIPRGLAKTVTTL